MNESRISRLAESNLESDDAGVRSQLEPALPRLVEREEPIPVVFCVDVEPDAREVDRSSAEAWTGFEKFLLSVGRIREAFATATGRPAQFTWFLRMDPQVAETWGTPTWPAETYERQLAELTGEGDELGIHPHSWRWDGAGGQWVSDQGDEGWVAHCAQMALDAYEEAFGRPCAAYRHGDRSMTTPLARLIDESGVQVDLTVEPGLPGTFGLAPGEMTTGWIESTEGAPPYPYRPSRDDFRVPDPDRTEGLVMIPLTRGLDIDTVVERGRLRPRGRWETLILWDDPARFRERLSRRLSDPSLTHLAFAVRTELPLTGFWTAFEKNLAELCRHPISRHLRFCTASEALAQVDPKLHGRGADLNIDATTSRRAGLWAGGAQDPGHVEHAELDALEIVGAAAARSAELTDELTARLETEQARASELTARLETEQARASELTARLETEQARASELTARLETEQARASELETRAVAETERANDLATRLETTEAALAKQRAASEVLDQRLNVETDRSKELAERLDMIVQELQAVYGTATWRAHDRLLPILRFTRRIFSRRPLHPERDGQTEPP